MAQRGRKSSLNVVPLDPNAVRPRLTPPSILTKAERLLFAEVAAANRHLKAGDVPLLTIYVQGLLRVQRLAKQADAAAWEKSVRAVLSIATKLRVTAQSQVHPETAARKRQTLPPSYYETMMEADDD